MVSLLALPAVLLELPCAHEVIEWPLQIGGSFAVEIFAGHAGVSLALTFEKVPCMRPWDTSYGEEFDVLRHSQILYELVDTRQLVAAHFATPYQSMSWGRLPQLRSWSYILGTRSLSGSQLALVNEGNALACFTVCLCLRIMARRGYFSVVNPCLSWLWAIPSMRDLYAEESTAFTILAYRDYGTSYVKPTAILHNTPCMHELWRPVAELAAPIVLRGQVVYGKRLTARTSLASMYPPEFAKCIGKAFRKSLELRDAALLAGHEVPMAEGAIDDGFPLPEPPPGGNLGTGSWPVPPADVLNPFVWRGLGAPKGLTQREHIAWAQQQHHSLELADSIDDELLLCLQFEVDHSATEVDAFRSSVLCRIQAMAACLEPARVA